MTEENNPQGNPPADKKPADDYRAPWEIEREAREREEREFEAQARASAEQAAPGAADAEVLPEYTMSDLPAPLRAGFEKMGWTALMQVQARAIPYILAHRDVMIQSRTGSGKTGAYLVPVFQRINPEQNATQALVLLPTRELAQQVVHEAETLGSALNIRTVAVYGGVGYGPQLDAFR